MATRLIPAFAQFFDANGDPLAGGKIYTYESGTTTPKVTFSDAALSVANSNPVLLNSAGRAPDVFADAGDYKVVLTDANDVMIETRDPVDGAASGQAGIGLTGFKNILANGQFQLWQRGTPLNAADDTYTADAWYQLTQTANVTTTFFGPSDPGQVSCIRVQQSAASPQRFGIAQIVEQNGCVHLRSSTVTLSFRVRSSVAQTIRYAVLEWSGTADVVTSDVVADWTSTSYVPGGFFNASNLSVVASGSVLPSAGIWVSSLPISGVPSGAMNNLIVVIWTEGTFAQNATLDIGLAQLEGGDVATTFDYLPTTINTLRCQRYYYAGRSVIAGSATGPTTVSMGIQLPTILLKTPILNSTVVAETNCSDSTIVNLGSSLNSVRHATSATSNYNSQITFTVDASL